jgi:hypothetical protein
MATTRTNWDEQKRHTYGAKVGTATRATYGEHIRFGGTVKVAYKFIARTDYTQN